jgi:hypothetical protein
LTITRVNDPVNVNVVEPEVVKVKKEADVTVPVAPPDSVMLPDPTTCIV